MYTVVYSGKEVGLLTLFGAIAGIGVGMIITALVADKENTKTWNTAYEHGKLVGKWTERCQWLTRSNDENEETNSANEGKEIES